MPKLTPKRQKVADFVCKEISLGKSLREISRQHEDVSQTKIYNWLNKYEDFRVQYTRAREDQADSIFDEMLVIADDGLNDTYEDSEGNEKVNQDHIQRSRLRIETRKWMAGKLRPKKYGEKVVQEITGKDGGPIETTDIPASDRLASMLSAIKPKAEDEESG